MKLYLSSFRLGDHPEHLVALLPRNPSVAVVCNSIDAEAPDVRREKVAEEITWLTGLGLRAEELDLREVAGDDLRARLSAYDGIWMRGGNVFVLRIAMARSGADQILPDLIRAEELVYAGYSAGPCVLAPSLRGLELCDDTTALDGEVIWQGLGVLDHAIVPHLDSPGHPETELLAKVAELYDRTGVPNVKLTDGQALVIDGDRRELV
ncbi:Type 1 glutamine amidotransferase-like domain-containing protein [Kribbella speibonae]|uniref:Peptidase n=1 Tax=Kribbella speibonae TaxID=1572660 RepID=A0A4R0IXS2_9ACTN|nr:Type 1 glutamine amidotransferase-like domain-containing protein [Kribbella speibonae]TCC23911.1 peptidase [Kribbella speibonae]TCC38047.1 peptidase [Kribbella speibonae]